MGNVDLEISTRPSANTAISEAFSERDSLLRKRCLESLQQDPNLHKAWNRAQRKKKSEKS